MKTGIIGTGRIAQAHANAIQELPALDLNYCFDINDQSLNQFAHHYQATACKTVNEVIDNSELIIIASPNHCHFEQALAALNANKKVLCEKPMATNIEQAEQMNKHPGAMDNAYLGFNYRFMPIAQVIRDYVLGGELGDILAVNFSFKKNSALSRKTFTWRDDGKGHFSSGALGDLGVHFIDWVPYLFRQDINVFSGRSKIMTHITHKENRRVGVDDYAWLSCRTEAGSYVTMEVSKSSPIEECGVSIEIIGSQMELKFNSAQSNQYLLKKGIYWDVHPLTVHNIIDDPSNEIPGWSDSFLLQLQALLQDKGQQIARFDDGYKAQFVLDFLTKSLTTQQALVS